VAKVILTDVDEVLFDWASPFEDWVRSNYPSHDPATALRDHWHVEAWLNCELSHSRELIREFNSDELIWPYFEPLPKTEDYVEKLHNEGWKFVAITACDVDEATFVGRMENLRSCFGMAFDTLHCVGLAASKADILSRYRPTYWVEDKFKHAVSGADLGHTSFLVNYKHNERDHDDRLIRVTDWEDIYNHIHYREANPEEFKA
jgi:5'(3')-deoxyribonucleotidase